MESIDSRMKKSHYASFMINSRKKQTYAIDYRVRFGKLET